MKPIKEHQELTTRILLVIRTCVGLATTTEWPPYVASSQSIEP